MILTPTSTTQPIEDVAPGDGRNGLGGGVGVPTRYQVTNRANVTLAPWTDGTLTYSLSQISLGSNPNSKLEIVSAINSFNLGHFMFHYNYTNCTSKYNPRVYIGTTQTTSPQWNYDNTFTSISGWPQSYQQVSQKGEANKKVKHQFTSLFTLY